MNRPQRLNASGAFLILLVMSVDAVAATIIGDPFTNSYAGWTDAFPPPTRAGNWRLNLHNPTLMDTNNANPPTSGATNNAGTYEPDVLYQNNFVAPATYDLSATMRTNDDDIIGLVWNYQDPNNYFRVGIRTQASGTFGGTQGLAVQKIVGGVVTQISPNGTGVGAATPITQAMINNRTPFDLKVAVNGTNWAVHFNNNPVPIVSGTDADLVSGRKIGIQSWAQLSDTDETPDPPFWGTEVESISVVQGASTLYSESFANRSVAFRPMVMTNQTGTSNTGNQTASREPLGNFGVSINNPWIHQHSNGFVFATNNVGGNVDFIGPGVVVDEPGSTSLTDYEMKVRIGATDDDGLGVLVRVQDDNNFYRINFARQAMLPSSPASDVWQRAPQGLSIQKVVNGVWSEVFRDNQASPLFVYQNGTAGSNPSTSGFPMFDLSVRMIGNTFDIQVVDHLGNVIDYPLITDAVNPLLSGSVGLTTWGTDNVYYMGHGGQPGPLLIEIPEPTTFGLLMLAAIAPLLRRHGRCD
jgi:hypothetical protein